jgi:hypothetical protein
VDVEATSASRTVTAQGEAWNARVVVLEIVWAEIVRGAVDPGSQIDWCLPPEIVLLIRAARHPDVEVAEASRAARGKEQEMLIARQSRREVETRLAAG